MKSFGQFKHRRPLRASALASPPEIARERMEIGRKVKLDPAYFLTTDEKYYATMYHGFMIRRYEVRLRTFKKRLQGLRFSLI